MSVYVWMYIEWNLGEHYDGLQERLINIRRYAFIFHYIEHRKNEYKMIAYQYYGSMCHLFRRINLFMRIILFFLATYEDIINCSWMKRVYSYKWWIWWFLGERKNGDSLHLGFSKCFMKVAKINEMKHYYS